MPRQPRKHIVRWGKLRSIGAELISPLGLQSKRGTKKEKRKKRLRRVLHWCICRLRVQRRILAGCVSIAAWNLQSEIAGCGCKQKRAAAWLDGFKDGIPWGFMTLAA